MNQMITSIYQLCESSSKPLAAFIGSGLSVPEPSSLPLTKEVIVSLLNLDWVVGDEKFPIPESQIENSDLYKIRLEHILSIFNEWGHHDLGHLLRQFADAPPNWYHKKIAEFCQKQKIKCIVTTNFDLCLEKALQEYNFAYNVIVTEDDKYSNDPNIMNIFKIHGSIEFSNDRYFARGLGATLESIYSGLSAWKRHIILKLLDQYTFVFLGYSGSDSYDINPVLYELSNSNLFWVVHKNSDEDKQIPSEVTNILARSKYSNPIQIDTAVFLGGTPQPLRKNKFRFMPTYNLEELWHPSVFVGRVLEAINDYKSAQSYYEMVLEKSTGSRYLMVEILNLIRSNAVALYELKDYKAASGALLMGWMVLSSYIKRMEADKYTPEKLKRDIILDQCLLMAEEQSIIDSELGKKESAFENLEMAFKCLKSMDCEEITKLSIESRLLLNRCSIKLKLLDKQHVLDHSEYLIAVEDLKKVCKIKRRIGDVTGLIKGLAQLGRLYVILGEVESSESVYINLFNEIQKLRTPIDERLFNYVVEFLNILVYLRLTEYKNANIINYFKKKSNTALQFEIRIKNLLMNEVHKSSNEVMERMLKDEELLKYFNKLKEEIDE